LHLAATSCAASMAAYGDDSSLSALTFIPPEVRNQRHKEIKQLSNIHKTANAKPNSLVAKECCYAL